MNFLNRYPELTGAVILLLGYFLSRWLAEFTLHVISRIEMRLGRLVGIETGLILGERNSKILQRIMFYLWMALFTLVAVRFMGVGTLSGYLDSVLIYVPKLILAVIILLLGYLLSVVARNITRSMMTANQPASFPLLVQWTVLSIAILTGLEQMQLDISFLTNLLILFVGVILSGLTLAFVLGSRQLVGNLLASRELSRYSLGDELRVDDLKGIVCDIHQTGLILQSDDGLVNVPAARFAEAPVVLLQSSNDSANPDE